MPIDDCLTFPLISIKSMQTDDFNPYAPPTPETASTAAPRQSPGDRYRIEKNVMILPPPFVLPEACFLTGVRQNLQQFEIPLKVMPRWWNYVMPIIMLSTQIGVVFGSRVIQKLQLPAPPWLVPPLSVALIGFTIPVMIVAGVLVVAKKITLTGFRENSDTVFIRRRRFIGRVLIFDLILGLILVLSWLILPPAFPVVVISLMSVSIAFIVTLIVCQRNRKPWSRIGALQQADGSLAIYGLDPSFLAVCRLGLDDPAAPPASIRSA